MELYQRFDPNCQSGKAAPNAVYTGRPERDPVPDGDRMSVAMPKDYPHWQSVYTYFHRFRDDGTWQRIHETPRAQVRYWADDRSENKVKWLNEIGLFGSSSVPLNPGEAV